MLDVAPQWLLDLDAGPVLKDFTLWRFHSDQLSCNCCISINQNPESNYYLFSSPCPFSLLSSKDLTFSSLLLDLKMRAQLKALENEDLLKEINEAEENSLSCARNLKMLLCFSDYVLLQTREKAVEKIKNNINFLKFTVRKQSPPSCSQKHRLYFIKSY